MTKFSGEYSLLFVMPDACRRFYQTLDLAEQKRVVMEVVGVIKGTFDPRQLESWEEREINADADGFKPESEVRRELARAIAGLDVGENRLGLADEGPVAWGHDKKEDCSTSFHFEYPILIGNARDSRRRRPWIIRSSSYPQVVFEMRVAVNWAGPSTYAEIVPVERKRVAKAEKTPSMQRKEGRPTRRRPTRR